MIKHPCNSTKYTYAVTTHDAFYLAGNCMPSDAFTQIIDRLVITGSECMLVLPNVELSLHDQYRHAKIETASKFDTITWCKIMDDILKTNLVSFFCGPEWPGCNVVSTFLVLHGLVTQLKKCIDRLLISTEIIQGKIK